MQLLRFGICSCIFGKEKETRNQQQKKRKKLENLKKLRPNGWVRQRCKVRDWRFNTNG
jgi:hypothetical protein